MSRRSAGEAGWHESRYNLKARIPGTDNVAVANLYRGTCVTYNPIELFLLSSVEQLDEHHPAVARFARHGTVCNFDELAALEAMARGNCAFPHTIGLVICPTMACNFDCPYCYEARHAGVVMGREVQDDVVALAARMMDAAGTDSLHVLWFGGEPLLAPQVIDELSPRLVKVVEERGGTYTAQIITNGYLLTQDNVDLLSRHGTISAQVTLDGLGETHDATRHLAGGGPTFERIVRNLSGCHIPFRVNVRHNVHEGNRAEMGALRALVEKLATESGNDLRYYPAVVVDSVAAEARGEQVGLLHGTDASAVITTSDDAHFSVGHGYYCGAPSLWNVYVDDQGNLQKCSKTLDFEQMSFGTARRWDPTDPIATADRPDMLTSFLNAALPLDDEECRACVWLPQCAGGCPYMRRHIGRACVPYRHDVQNYVLALYERSVRGS